MKKKVQVIFEQYNKENWSITVEAKNANLAIVSAYQHFVSEGLSVHDITNITTKKSDSYL
jgi:hypothetical protein